MKHTRIYEKLAMLTFSGLMSNKLIAAGYSGSSAMIAGPFEKIIEIATGPLLTAITVISVIIVGYILLSGQFSKVLAFRIAIGVAVLHSAAPLANFLVK